VRQVKQVKGFVISRTEQRYFVDRKSVVGKEARLKEVMMIQEVNQGDGLEV